MWLYSGSVNKGFRFDNGGDLLAGISFSGQYADGRSERQYLGASARYYLQHGPRNVFFVSASADALRNPYATDQLLLGGDNGLRGYPLRYQAGDRRVLATVEQRFYTDWHLFRLLHVGAAAFADFGRAWYDGQPPKAPDDTVYRDGWLSDVGFGLRLSSSRSGQGSMVHLDVAFPLERDPSIESVQWLVSTRETF